MSMASCSFIHSFIHSKTNCTMVKHSKSDHSTYKKQRTFPLNGNVMKTILWLAKWCKIHKVYVHSHSMLLLLFTNIFLHMNSTTEFTFKKYVYSHLPVNFLFTIIFAHIYKMSSFTFNKLYSFTFTIEIFIQHFLHTTFAYH